MTIEYPISIPPNACVCGATNSFLPIEALTVVTCTICNRIFTVDFSTDTMRILLPWRGFRPTEVKGTKPCLVCHGFTNFDAPESRYTCDESFCGYSWFEKFMGTPRSVRRLLDEKQRILEEWTTKPGAMREAEIIIRIKTIQEEISVLESSYWVK